jgi:hypothetical protein
MKYHSEFPRVARARVEAETLRAYSALEQEVQGTASRRRDGPFIRCVMRVFLVFAREACEFGKKSGHRAWSDRELDRRCRDFLLEIVIDAWEDNAKDLGIRRIFSAGGWGYSLDDDVRRQIEKSPEWKQYQELLLDAFESQSQSHPPRPASKGPSGGLGRKMVRQTTKYVAIDAALRTITESRPASHEDVFRALDGRARVPDAKPFGDAGE